MPSRPVQALLAVEPGVDAEDVKDSLPGGGEDFQIVGVVTGADEALTWLRGGVADLLLVACAGYSDRALLLLDGVARQNPELNVMVLGQGSPNGFLRRAFEAGADDIVMLPATPEQIRFEIHKLMARKTSVEIAPQNEHSRLVCILGPKGGTGKTLSSTNLSVCLAQGHGQRPLSPDRRPDPVQEPQPRPAHLPDLAAVGDARQLRHPGAGPAAARPAVVRGVGGRHLPEPQPHLRRDARALHRVRRRPHLPHGSAADGAAAHRVAART